jgi:uncharacterized delta-60 repeat protein
LEDRCLLSGGGALDPTFGNGAGYVTTSNGSGTGNAHAVLLQPDGKIVALGQANTATGREAAVERYNPDGSLDASFGSGGIALENFGTGGYGWGALYPQAGTANDGKIVQAGMLLNATTGQTDRIFVARYNPNGSLDGTFGSGGETTTAIAGASLGGVVVTGSGQVVALSQDSAGDVVLVRYNTDGSLDNTFGQGGEVITPAPGGSCFPESLLQQPDGKLIAVGYGAQIRRALS